MSGNRSANRPNAADHANLPGDLTDFITCDKIPVVTNKKGGIAVPPVSYSMEVNRMSSDSRILPHDDSNRQISTFVFNGQSNIRVTCNDNGEPQFVAADVCRALDIADTSAALRRLDDDEKGTATIPTPGGQQALLTVNEPGLYSLILTSRKPEAKTFKRWITHEVLPSIRKTGGYSVKPLSPAHQLLLAAQQLVDHEQRLARLEAQVQREPDYFTVMGYARLHSYTLSLNQAQGIGQRATALSRARGVSVGKTTDPRYGEVNTYHVSILDEVVKQHGS